MKSYRGSLYLMWSVHLILYNLISESLPTAARPPTRHPHSRLLQGGAGDHDIGAARPDLVALFAIPAPLEHVPARREVRRDLDDVDQAHPTGEEEVEDNAPHEDAASRLK